MNNHQLSIDAKIGEVNSFINLWKDNGGEIGKLSDGFHTFDQLYEHRIELFLVICKQYRYAQDPTRTVWYSQKHSDGTSWPGWFILGIGTTKGNQITYHLPEDKYLDRVSRLFICLDKAPEWDGHTPEDVIERLKKL